MERAYGHRDVGVFRICDSGRFTLDGYISLLQINVDIMFEKTKYYFLLNYVMSVNIDNTDIR